MACLMVTTISEIVLPTFKFVCYLAAITESPKSYSVNQISLRGDLRSDLISMFEDDHVLRHFNRLFDGKGMSQLLSGDKEVI